MNKINTLEDLRDMDPTVARPKYYFVKRMKAIIIYLTIIMAPITAFIIPFTNNIGWKFGTGICVFMYVILIPLGLLLTSASTDTSFTGRIGKWVGISFYQKRLLIWNRLWQEHREYQNYLRLMNKYELGGSEYPLTLHQDMLAMASAPAEYRFLHFDKDDKRSIIVEDSNGNEIRIDLRNEFKNRKNG